MLLKRVYEKGELSHVKVLRAAKVQKLSTDFVEKQLSSGLLSIGKGMITFTTHKDDEPCVYRIVASPGYYCCHCNVGLGGEGECKTHVAEEHPKTESPDPNNPSGYRRENCYTCVLEDGKEKLSHDEAEKLVQKQRKDVIKRIGEKHLTAVHRATSKGKTKKHK